MLAPWASKSKSSRPDSPPNAASDCIAGGASATCHRCPRARPRCPCPQRSPASRVFVAWRIASGTSLRASAAASSASPKRSERSFLISSIFDLILFWLFFNCIFWRIAGAPRIGPGQLIRVIVDRIVGGWVLNWLGIFHGGVVLFWLHLCRVWLVVLCDCLCSWVQLNGLDVRLLCVVRWRVGFDHRSLLFVWWFCVDCGRDAIYKKRTKKFMFN